jgi:hypothetical protein
MTTKNIPGDLDGLRKRISEIISDLNATQSKERSVQRSYRGGDEGRNADNWYWTTETVKVPDEARIKKGRQDLETLVKNTEPALLVQIPEPVVLDEVAKVYGTNAIPHFIIAFNKQKVDSLRDVLVKFGDERVLPVLRDASSVDGYVSVFARLNDGYELIRQLVSGKIHPDDFRKNVGNYVRMHPKVISEQFETAYQTLGRMLNSQFWNLNLNDLNLTLRLVDKEPGVILEVFDHPSDSKNWEFHPYTCEVIDWSVGKAAIPVLMSVMTSEKYPHHLRSYAAAGLRKIDDLETNKTLLAMLDTSNCRYAAKALVRSHFFSYEDITPKTLAAFFLHYKEIEEGDFEVAIESDKQNLQILIDVLVDAQRDSELKAKILDSLVEKAWWFRSGNQSSFDEEMRRLADYYVSSGYEEGVFCRLFSGHIAIDILNGLYGTARNEDKDVGLRKRALRLIGENSKGWIGLEECRDIKSYLRRAGSKLVGKFFEPNEEVRLAAREAHRKAQTSK